MLFFSRRIERHVRRVYAETFLVLLMLWTQILKTSADVIAVSPQNVTSRFASLPSSFGPPLPSSGMEGLLVIADPIEACAPIASAPTLNDSRSYQFIALIKRGNCDFDQKVLNAQNANYRAAIVYNNVGDALTPMGGSKYGDQVIIFSVFVGLSDGLTLQGMNYTTGYKVTLLPYASPSWAYYFLPFISVTSTCLLFFVIYAIAKYVRDQRRRRRARLSRDHLKKLPIKKFKKGDEYDVCAICLDDYEEGQKLRILPCNHAFHCKCVDPWLTNNRRTCPICKRKVVPPGMADSDEDSDSENGDGPNENTPLLAGMESDGMSEHGAVGGRSEITTPPPSPVPSNDDDQEVPVVSLIHVESDSESGGSIPMEKTNQPEGEGEVTISGSHTTTGSVTIHSENELEPFDSKPPKC